MQDIGEHEPFELSAEIVPPVAKVVVDSVVKTESLPIVESAVEKHDGNSEAPATPEAIAESEAEAEAARKTTTTGIRKPLEIPSSVHVSISAENLLEYVGPPLYQKDRLYTKKSPVGVSCGLGYLGNGSGAVMPIEVSVRFTSRSRLRK